VVNPLRIASEPPSMRSDTPWPDKINGVRGRSRFARNAQAFDEENRNTRILALMKAEVADIGLSEFARRLRLDVSNLGKVVEGKRKLSRQLVARFDGYFRNHPAS
jgi:hypothetical protein